MEIYYALRNEAQRLPPQLSNVEINVGPMWKNKMRKVKQRILILRKMT